MNEKKYILIIEDNEKELEKLKNWVGSLGDYTVLPRNKRDSEKMLLAARNGRINSFVIETIKKYRKEIRMILCDIVLGTNYEGGVGVTKAVRGYNEDSDLSNWFENVPIVGVTAGDDSHLMIRAGAQEAFNKDDIEISRSPEERRAKGKVEKLIEDFENKLSQMKIDNKKVFIVHGRAGKETEVADFLKELGLEPIILREQADEGKTIIEKIERYSDVGFAVVLYTACDEGRLRGAEDRLKPRARQNVVFEHGYMIAKLGRERVCTLVEDGVELSTRDEFEQPGDTSGIVFKRMDAEGNWKTEIEKEMRLKVLWY